MASASGASVGGAGGFSEFAASGSVAATAALGLSSSFVFSVFFSTSHTVARPSLEQAMSHSPSGVSASDCAPAFSAPRSPSDSFFSPSHSLNSRLFADASRFPAFDSATERMPRLCPFNVAVSSPVARFHKRTVAS